MKKYKVELNNIDNLRELLQTTYEEADSQLIQAQNEINKLSSATKLQETIMEEKSKYSKAINDYLSIKDKAISKKLEIAKLMSEICKNSNNNVGEMNTSFGSFNFEDIRTMLDNDDNANKTETIKLNR